MALNFSEGKNWALHRQNKCANMIVYKIYILPNFFKGHLIRGAFFYPRAICRTIGKKLQEKVSFCRIEVDGRR